jgi:hypothetical protein
LGVDVIQLEPRLDEPLELRANLRGQLSPYAGAQEEAESRAHQVYEKLAALVHQIGNAFGRQYRATVDEHDVQADRKSGRPKCALDGVGRCRRAYHQARRAQRSVAMRALDRLVDLRRGSEIVGVEDEALQ